MDAAEARARIRDCLGLLEGYRGFSLMVDGAIEDLRAMDDCVAEPTEEKLSASRRRLSRLLRDIDPYRGFVPSLSGNLDALAAWFEATA